MKCKRDLERMTKGTTVELGGVKVFRQKFSDGYLVGEKYARNAKKAAELVAEMTEVDR